MFLFNMFGAARWGDLILIGVNVNDLWFAVTCWTVLGLWAVRWATRPQPVPDRVNWGAIPADRMRKGHRW